MSSTARFDKRARLSKAAEYKHVFDQAFRSSDQYFTVLARPGTDRGARLGLAITKKKLKRAVSRNRLKRIIRESFRQSRDTLTTADFVVMAQAACDQVDNAMLFESLERHWKKISDKCERS